MYIDGANFFSCLNCYNNFMRTTILIYPNIRKQKKKRNQNIHPHISSSLKQWGDGYFFLLSPFFGGEKKLD